MEEEEMDLSTFDYEDLIRLPAMTLEGVKANLYNRYDKDKIYTYTGAILLSVNPYKTIPDLYTKNVSSQYHAQALGDLPPHVFAIADAAFTSLLDSKTNQSIIISGESGAGKTEATKLMLRYLTGRSSHHTVVEEMILESNPILEAFGNAQTVRNYNSSRFGKYIELMISPNGTVCEGRVTDYLLEKSRIVAQDEGERGYHIFYQLVNCCPTEERSKFGLGKITDYKCLKTVSERWTLEADQREWNALLTAMHFLGVTNVEKDSIFAVVAAVLHLGNVEFEPTNSGDDACKVSTPEDLERAAIQLGVTAEKLEKALCWRTNVIAGQSIVSPFELKDCKQTLLALQKSLYSKLFRWVVERVNVALKAGAKAEGGEHANGELNTIGCLDIFGFEDFKHNSFEQLCINYVNEKLQLQFNDHVFRAEQDLYKSEGIEVPNIGYGDNKPCLELIEGKLGIFALLSEESRFPRSSDDSFLKKIINQHGKHAYFGRNMRSQVSFKVKHYAGEVEYNVTGFLEKTRDKLSDDAQELVRNSSISFYASLFQVPSEDNQKGGKRRAPQDLGIQFRNSVQALYKNLGETHPYYVRCLKPNLKQKPKLFDNEMVLGQLAYLGVTETIRIRKLGYPYSYSFSVFCRRFRCFGCLNVKDERQRCVQIMDKLKGKWKEGELGPAVGRTKVFLKDIHAKELEEVRRVELTKVSIFLQKHVRGFLARVKYQRMRRSAIIIQKWTRSFLVRNWYLNVLESCIKIQAFGRMVPKRKEYIRKYHKVITCQAAARRFLAKQTLKKLQEEKRKQLEREKREKERAEALAKASEKEKEKLRKKFEEEERALREEEEKQKKAEEEKEKEEQEKKRKEAEEAEKEKEKKKKKKKEDVFQASNNPFESLETVAEKNLAKMVDNNSHQLLLTSPRVMDGFEKDLSKTPREVQDRFKGSDTNREKRPMNVPMMKMTASMMKKKGGRRNQQGLMRQREGGKGRLGRQLSKQMSLLMPKLRASPFPTETAQDKYGHLYLIIRPSEIELYKFTDFAKDHFRNPNAPLLSAKKKFSLLSKKGTKMGGETIEKRTKFSPTPLTGPLTNLYSAELEKAALEVSELILNFVLDSDVCHGKAGKISKKSLGYAQRIAALGLKYPSLRDEIYCQLLKQTLCVAIFPFKTSMLRGGDNKKNKNAPPEAVKSMEGLMVAVKGWELLSICVTCFAPTLRLQKVVAAHMLKVLGMEDVKGLAKDLRELAMGALDSFQKNLIASKLNRVRQRRYPPSVTEISCIILAKPVLCKCVTLTGEGKGIFVDSHSTAFEVQGALTDRIGLKNIRGFSIFEEYKFGNNLRSEGLAPDCLMVDALAKYERMCEDIGREDIQLQFVLKRRGFFTKPNWGDAVERSLDFKELCMRALSGELWAAPKGGKGSKKDKGDEGVLAKVGGYLAQVELGDVEKGGREYADGGYIPVGSGKKGIEGVKKEHKKLKGTSKEDAQSAGLELFLSSFPLSFFRIFNITTTTSPKDLPFPAPTLLAISSDRFRLFSTPKSKPDVDISLDSVISLDWEEEKEWGEGEKKGLKIKLEVEEGIGMDLIVECEIANEIYEIFELLVLGNEDKAKYARAKEMQHGGDGWLLDMKEGDYIKILGKSAEKACNGSSASNPASGAPPPTTSRNRTDSGWLYGENLATKSRGYFPVGFARFYSQQVSSISESAIKHQNSLREQLEQLEQQQQQQQKGKKGKKRVKEATGECELEQLVKSDNFGLTDCLLIEGPQHVPLLRFGEEGGEFWRGGRGGGGWSAVVAKHIFVRLFQLCGIYPLSSCHPALLKKDNYHKSLFPEVEEEMKKIGELVTEKSEHTASLIQDIVCLTLSSPPRMQDELFLQIICLLHSISLKREARRVLWEVFSVCCGVLVATESCVRDSVEGLLKPPLGPEDRDDVVIQSIAHQAQLRLNALKQKRKVKKNANQFCRKYGISQWEVRGTISNAPVVARVFESEPSMIEFMDDFSKGSTEAIKGNKLNGPTGQTISIASEMTVEAVLKLICAQNNFDPDALEPFTLSLLLPAPEPVKTPTRGKPPPLKTAGSLGSLTMAPPPPSFVAPHTSSIKIPLAPSEVIGDVLFSLETRKNAPNFEKMGLCLLLHRYKWSSADLRLPFLSHVDLGLTFQTVADEALGGWWGGLSMERAVGLLAKHYCHDVLISLVADDCKRYTKEEQRKKERMRGGYKGSGWPLPKVREIDGDTLDETDIILWTRFVEQKKASGEPGPHCSARGGGGMSTRRPIEEMVSPDVFEKADEVTSKVMQEINWEEPVAPGASLIESPMARNSRKVQRTLIDEVSSAFEFSGAFYFPLLDMTKKKQRMYLAILMEGIGFFVSEGNVMKLKVFFPFNSILTFSANCEEILITVGTLFHPTTHHFTPYFQPEIGAVPRHPEEEMFLGGSGVAEQLFSHMDEKIAIDWFQKARRQLLVEKDTRKEFEAQVSNCLSLLLSSAPSFRYAHSENSVSPASQLSHMYNPWGDLEEGMEDEDDD